MKYYHLKYLSILSFRLPFLNTLPYSLTTFLGKAFVIHQSLLKKAWENLLKRILGQGLALALAQQQRSSRSLLKMELLMVVTV